MNMGNSTTTPPLSDSRRWQFWIDRGGTFTDVFFAWTDRAGGAREGAWREEKAEEGAAPHALAHGLVVQAVGRHVHVVPGGHICC
jgi:hypothetical protein